MRRRVLLVVVQIFVAAFVGALSGKLFVRREIALMAVTQPLAPSEHGKVGANVFPGTNTIGVRYLPSSDACSGTDVCQFRDVSDGKLKIRNADGTLTVNSPGWSQSSSLGTWQQQIQMDGPDANDDYMLRYTHAVDATGTVRGPWNFICGSNHETSTDVPDYVDNTCQWGWNAGGGGNYLSGQPSMYWQLEQFFVPGAPGVKQMEGHLIFNAPDGVTQYRPLSVEGHLDGGPAGYSRLLMHATQWTLGGGKDANAADAGQIGGQGDNVQVQSGDGKRIFFLDDSNYVLQDAKNTNRAEIILGSQPSVNGAVTVVGDVPPGADDSYDLGEVYTAPPQRWRNGYISRVHGGCNTVANRPNCLAAQAGNYVEGGWYSVCSINGVSDGVEQVCHCTSGGSCSWVTK